MCWNIALLPNKMGPCACAGASPLHVQKRKGRGETTPPSSLVSHDYMAARALPALSVLGDVIKESGLGPVYSSPRTGHSQVLWT